MSPLGIPQAAGITGILTAAGLPAEEVHSWFGRPRQELAGLTPRVLLSLSGTFVAAGQIVLELARRDATELQDRSLPDRWEGSE